MLLLQKVPLDNLERHEERCGLTPHVCHLCKRVREIQLGFLEDAFLRKQLMISLLEEEKGTSGGRVDKI